MQYLIYWTRHDRFLKYGKEEDKGTIGAGNIRQCRFCKLTYDDSIGHICPSPPWKTYWDYNGI